jgi:hypothetical protein
MFHKDKCTNMEYSVTNANINYNITTNYNKKIKMQKNHALTLIGCTADLGGSP